MPLSYLAPPFTASVAVAALFVGYVAEEWAHHAMHFDNFQWRYFQYVRRRHLYHHSRLGVGTAYGITSDFWDKVFGTRIPAPQRDRLLPGARGAPRHARPCCRHERAPRRSSPARAPGSAARWRGSWPSAAFGSRSRAGASGSSRETARLVEAAGAECLPLVGSVSDPRSWRGTPSDP